MPKFYLSRVHCIRMQAKIWDEAHHKYAEFLVTAKCRQSFQRYKWTRRILTPKEMDDDYPGWDKC